MKRLVLAALSGALAFQVTGEEAHDTPPAGVKVPAFGVSHPPPTLEKRRELISAVGPGELRVRPTFVSCGVCWGSADSREPIEFRCRRAGSDEWTRTAEAVPFPETGDCRGSLMGLEEATDYELAVVQGGRQLASTRFRTWASEVRVARTVEIDPGTVSYPLVIADKGTPDGWVRSVTKGGAPLGGEDLRRAIVIVRNARHVLLDGIAFIGGGGSSAVPLLIESSRGVRVCNCEFSGWGRTGAEEFRLLEGGRSGGGNRVDPDLPNRRGNFINYDAAIRIDRGNSEIVVERCYAHDPRGTANSWFYSHPHGPCAVFMVSPDHSTVIRHNDFVGSDDHRWNDAVEGAGNFKADGGFNQDADVYGNFMIFANDDCIELDGGMQNVRCFGNRFESAISGVSIQGCCASPVYVHDNLFSGMGEEHGFCNSSVKTSTLDPWWYRPYASLRGNFFQNGTCLAPFPGKGTRWQETDNRRICGDEQGLLADYPKRPVGLTLDCGRLSARAALRDAAPQVRTVRVRNDGAKVRRFRVRKGKDADWLRIVPSEGTVPPGGEMPLEVTFDVTRLTDRAVGCAAFLIRTDEGLSRAVSVYLERTDFENPRHPVAASARTMYRDAVADGKDGLTAEFEVEEAGDYWFFFRGTVAGPTNGGQRDSRVWVSVDGAEKEKMNFRFWDYPTWTMVRPGKQGSFDGVTRHFRLEKGVHRLTVWSRKESPVNIEAMALTDTPKAFEPRVLAAAAVVGCGR